jgi:hypothetical protein
VYGGPDGVDSALSLSLSTVSGRVSARLTGCSYHHASLGLDTSSPHPLISYLISTTERGQTAGWSHMLELILENCHRFDRSNQICTCLLSFGRYSYPKQLTGAIIVKCLAQGHIQIFHLAGSMNRTTDLSVTGPTLLSDRLPAADQLLGE